MEELREIIIRIKIGDEEAFSDLLSKMRGLIVNYARKLYKDEFDDTFNELVLALWLAARRIEYYENDGQIINYLVTGVRQKFLDLYRKSVKEHDHEICMDLAESEYIFQEANESSELEAMTKIWIDEVLSNSSDKTHMIYKEILLNEKSDAEIAESLSVSRQYVHRLRRRLAEKYREDNGK